MGTINKWEDCKPCWLRGGDSVNMQQETMFDFCREGLTNNRFKQGLQRSFCTCLPSETQPKRTLCLDLTVVSRDSLPSSAVSSLTWAYRTRKDLLKSWEGKCKSLGVGLKTDASLIISQAWFPSLFHEFSKQHQIEANFH